ncbi:MAG: hypothetical protein AAF242_17125, partial [Bacteroidota bacterium]
MNKLKLVLQQYRSIEAHIMYAIGVQFSVQVVSTSFFLLLNYYMVGEGYPDFRIAEVLSFRFLAVFCLAFPVGLYIKGRRLKPFFMIAAVANPIMATALLWAIKMHYDPLINILAMTWGLSYMCIQVTILPFILLNGRKEIHSEAFSLSFLTFSGTIAVIGLGNYILHWLNPSLFSVENVLRAVALLSLFGLYFVGKINIQENLSYKVPFNEVLEKYDWKTIIQAVIPTLIISIGAGFTIPVINLFFLNVHGVESGTFSLLGSTTYFLVVCVILLMPSIKRKF